MHGLLGTKLFRAVASKGRLMKNGAALFAKLGVFIPRPFYCLVILTSSMPASTRLAVEASAASIRIVIV